MLLLCNNNNFILSLPFVVLNIGNWPIATSRLAGSWGASLRVFCSMTTSCHYRSWRENLNADLSIRRLAVTFSLFHCSAAFKLICLPWISWMSFLATPTQTLTSLSRKRRARYDRLAYYAKNLLLFNNTDDPNTNPRNFIPSSSHGNFIITSLVQPKPKSLLRIPAARAPAWRLKMCKT